MTRYLEWHVNCHGQRREGDRCSPLMMQKKPALATWLTQHRATRGSKAWLPHPAEASGAKLPPGRGRGAGCENSNK